MRLRELSKVNPALGGTIACLEHRVFPNREKRIVLEALEASPTHRRCYGGGRMLEKYPSSAGGIGWLLSRFSVSEDAHASG